jgi:hypothetical protein
VLSIVAISAAGYAWSETTAAAPTSASAREAAVAALSQALRDDDPAVRALAADALGRFSAAEQPQIRVRGLVVSTEVRLGEALTAASVLIALAALLLAHAKDRQLRRKEFADRVRNAAATTLAKLERLRDISLLKYREVGPLFVEASEQLAKAWDVASARDHLWRQLAATQAAMSERVLKEDIETAYVGLYPYDVTVYERFGETIAQIRRIDESAWTRFMDAIQDSVLSWHDREQEYQSALLGNQLRGVGAKYLDEIRDDIDDLIRENRTFLGNIVRMPDHDIATRRGLSADDKGRGESATRAPSAGRSAKMEHGAPGARRRALCVGIDLYPTAPLSGAVADARVWADVLQTLGFTRPLVLVNQEAKRQTILDALRRLIGSSVAGDVLVFQFSGHGTHFQALDQTGRVVENEKVEAVCPFDYFAGKVIFSADMLELFAETPEGVSLTCFLDCSYTGVITRVSPGQTREATPRPADQRARFLGATPEMNAAFRAFQQRLARGGSSSLRRAERLPAVIFEAARSGEVAMESGGHGNFSRNATRLLRAVGGEMTNAEFIKAVENVEGLVLGAHPQLTCPPAMLDIPVLAPCAPLEKRHPTAVDAAAHDRPGP